MHAGDTRADALLGAYPEAGRKHRRVRDLGTLVLALVDSNGPLASVEALVALARWTWEVDRRLPLPEGVPPETAPAQRRLVALAAVLARPEARRLVRDKLTRFLADADGVKLLAEAGLPNDRGFLQETADRLFRRFLPAPRDDKDLAALVPRLFPGKSELAYLEALDPDTFARLCEALGAGDAADPVFAALERAAIDATVLLAARIQGLGLSEGVRDRGRLGPLGESPFYLLPRAGDRFVALIRSGGDHGARVAAERDFRAAIDGCREELRGVLRRLETAGVSLDVVYTIEVMERALTRLGALIEVLSAAPGPERVASSHRLLVDLVWARQAERSLRELAYINLHLLARKLVERAGQTGEHYITGSRREYTGMLARAAGGGLLTAVTATGKLMLGSTSLPLFLSGLINSTNYALSFVVLQICGFTLATKQPSMTAAALAGTLGHGARERLGELIDLTARIVRSQLAAAVGNVTLVTVGAIGIDLYWQARHGGHVIGAAKAENVIASFHPTHSGTAFYAVITGVILWASSLAGGWLENFAVCHRLPQAIADHRLGRFLGRRTLVWASGVFARNVSGIGVSLALGFMLGMTPAFGAFFGLPIDVRHITLSTGQLAFAIASLGIDTAGRPDVLAAVAGLAIIFVGNLGTSFFLALAVALRAREVPRRDRWMLFTAIARAFFRNPLPFFFPPRS